MQENVCNANNLSIVYNIAYGKLSEKSRERNALEESMSLRAEEREHNLLREPEMRDFLEELSRLIDTRKHALKISP